MNQSDEDALVNRAIVGYEANGNRDAIRLAIRAAYAKGREDAAKVCESLCADYYPHARGPYLDCAAAIRKGE